MKKRNILKGGAFDIHKAIGKLPRPRRGFVPPGYRYLGSLNDLTLQLDENDDPKPGQEPTNNLDKIALVHDKCYRDNGTLTGKHNCDKVMLNELKASKSKEFGKKGMKRITQDVIGTKYKLG